MDTREDRERRRRRGGWLWMLLLLLVAIGAAIAVGVTRGDKDNGASSSGKGGVKGAQTSMKSGGVLTAGSTSLLDTSSFSSLTGEGVRAKGVSVVSVVGDEVFWVGTSSKRVLVHLTHTNGESAPTVRSGDRVSFTGSLAANGKHDTGIWGITKSEDANLYKSQKAHVEANVSTLKVQS